MKTSWRTVTAVTVAIVLTCGCGGSHSEATKGDGVTSGAKTPEDKPRADDSEERAVRAIEQRGGTVTRQDRGVDGPFLFVSLNTGGTTDTDLKEIKSDLKRLKNLAILSLNFSNVTDAGLKQLSELGTKVTDTGLKALARLPVLWSLGLDYTAATDAGLKSIKEIKGLRELSLRGTAVTAAGLKELKELATLQRLDLKDTGVTDEDVKGLKESMPNCKIDR